MTRIVDKLTERLAAPSSRRGFLGTMGKVVAGVAAAAAGIGTSAGLAFAGVPLGCCCCTGCPTYACPSGTYAGYSWICCDVYDCLHKETVCQDCFYNGTTNLCCTYPYGNGRTCPC